MTAGRAVICSAAHENHRGGRDVGSKGKGAVSGMKALPEVAAILEWEGSRA